MPEGTKIASVDAITHDDTLLFTARNGEIMCRKHGTTFEKGSGYCTFGPCKGATLDSIEVEKNCVAVYLTDDEYGFEPLDEVDPDAARDRSTNPGEDLASVC